MSLEYLTPEGFRVDGRRVTEPRRVACSIGTASGGEADGYAVFELGGTKAVAYVYGPMEARRAGGQSSNERAVLTCSLSTASFGNMVRSQRVRNTGQDRQSQERSHWIQQTFESAILLEQYPRSQIKLFVQILQSDGGGVSAAINAASLALADAGIPMRDLVVACSAGILGRKPALDLSREEENAGGAQILLAAHSGAKKISLVEVESKVPDGQFQPLYDCALAGCNAIAEQMRNALLEHATHGFSLRQSVRSGIKI
eukprot:TRINITY_DN103628_c0_g1_i1.p1 TRINITY_DN103628_c0_g1~~TRINITY_DN103628_c0_g1_i1.p1  ORF type:complete len:257 (+),score=37.89 TRINITY_DN103628_c0_g1_i1:46-816(+)